MIHSIAVNKQVVLNCIQSGCNYEETSLDCWSLFFCVIDPLNFTPLFTIPALFFQL